MKTTDKDFKYFVGRCEYWLNQLHLGNWEVSYEHKKFDDEPDGYARCAAYKAVFRARIELNEDWSGGDRRVSCPEELNKIALHEVLHILYKLPEEEFVSRLAVFITKLHDQKERKEKAEILG